MVPETRYARSGGVNIAYQAIGNGPRDLVLVPGWVSNIDVFWEEPTLARLLTRLASFSRLILFDKRGTGLSDRVNDMPSLELRMDDVRAVMDAVGSQRAALFGYSEGARCALCSPPRIRNGLRRSSWAALSRDAHGRPTTLGADGRAAPGICRPDRTRLGRTGRHRCPVP